MFSVIPSCSSALPSRHGTVNFEILKCSGDRQSSSVYRASEVTRFLAARLAAAEDQMVPPGIGDPGLVFYFWVAGGDLIEFCRGEGVRGPVF